MSADKKDLDKPDYSLIPKVFMDEVARCMMAGAVKYQRHQYLKGHKATQLIAAAERHLKELQEGEDVDLDSSERLGQYVLHAAAVAANMLMYIHEDDEGTLIDDRITGLDCLSLHHLQ